MHSAQVSTLGASLVILSLGPGAAGCAVSPPAREIADAETAIQAASRASHRDSNASLDRAVRKAALARRWLEAGDHGPARWLAEQAEVDAELAAAQAAAAEAVMGLAHRTRAALLMTSGSRPAE